MDSRPRYALTDFRNPLVSGWIESSSSGSSGSPITTAKSTALYGYRSVYAVLRAKEFGVPERAEICLQPILPFVRLLSAGGRRTTDRV